MATCARKSDLVHLYYDMTFDHTLFQMLDYVGAMLNELSTTNSL